MSKFLFVKCIKHQNDIHWGGGILRNRQLVNNTSYLPARQPIEMLENHCLLNKLY